MSEEELQAFLVITTLGIMVRHEAAAGGGVPLEEDTIVLNLAMAAEFGGFPAESQERGHLHLLLEGMARGHLLLLARLNMTRRAFLLTDEGRNFWLAMRQQYEAERTAGLRVGPRAFDPQPQSFQGAAPTTQYVSPGAGSPDASTIEFGRTLSALSTPPPYRWAANLLKPVLYLGGIAVVFGFTALWGALGFTVTGPMVAYGLYRMHQEFRDF